MSDLGQLFLSATLSSLKKKLKSHRETASFPVASGTEDDSGVKERISAEQVLGNALLGLLDTQEAGLNSTKPYKENA